MKIEDNHQSKHTDVRNEELTDLDDIIRAAAAKAEAQQREWTTTHLPVTIENKRFWLSAEVPVEIQQILNTLPKEKEHKPVKRPHQIKSRLSDKELESFEVLVKSSGLSQTDYIRGMVLNGTIEIAKTSLVDEKTLKTLLVLTTALGKIAGMLRNTMIVNQEFAVLTAEDKINLEHHLRSLRHLQSYIQSLAERIYGRL